MTYCMDPQHGRLVTWLQTKNTCMFDQFSYMSCKKMVATAYDHTLLRDTFLYAKKVKTTLA